MIKGLIVDDEESTLEEIKEIIGSLKEIEVVATASNAIDALKIIKEKDIQIVFLDINMPGMNGITLAEKITEYENNIEIVFITAYNQYALKAFEVNAIDYILKPIRRERVEKTLKKILKVIKGYNDDLKKSSFKIQSFKKIEVYLDGKSIKWRTLKDAELFAYFVQNVGVSLHKEKIIYDLWEDIDLKNALIYLQSSVYRIRKILNDNGYNDSIIYANNCYTLEYIDVDCDLWTFRDYISKKYNLSHDNIKEFEKLLDLYQGDYLEENGYLWSINLSENLRQRYLELIKNIGEYYINERDLSRAISYLEKAVEMSCFYDDAIKLLFKAYYSKGEIYNLKNKFIKLNEVSENYGVKFSEDIRKLYKDIL